LDEPDDPEVEDPPPVPDPVLVVLEDEPVLDSEVDDVPEEDDPLPSPDGFFA
jgi:hypothetical protein